jgi:hypothetical protein
MPEDYAKIIIAATHGKLTKVRDYTVIEGTIGALNLQCQFRTNDWNNTVKYALFVPYRANASTTSADATYVPLDTNNECEVPADAMFKDGYFSVCIVGTREDYRIATNWMCYRVNNGYYADGSTPIDPSSTTYEQLLLLINAKSNVDHNHNDIYYTKEESDGKYLDTNSIEGLATETYVDQSIQMILNADSIDAGRITKYS